MKDNIKIICTFLILVFLLGCTSNEKTDLYTERLKPKGRVDIWNSIQYETITDLKTMKTIEPEATENSYMLHFYLELENRGAETAEEFQVVFNEAYPMTYTNGSLNQGIDKGELKRKDNYEIMGYYIFENKENLAEFIEKSRFTIEWTDNNEKKRLVLKFPSEPTK